MLTRFSRPQDSKNPPRGMYLEPSKAVYYDASYTQDINRILLVGAESPEMGRMICLPSFESEWYVRLKQTGSDRFEVQSAEVRGGMIAHIRREPEPTRDRKRRALTVQTRKIGIEQDLALLLYYVWRSAVIEVHVPSEGPGGTDGETYHFAACEYGEGPFIPQRRGPVRYGEVWTPDKGTIAYRLVVLGIALRDLTTSRGHEWGYRRDDITERADSLWKDLGQRRWPR